MVSSWDAPEGRHKDEARKFFGGAGKKRLNSRGYSPQGPGGDALSCAGQGWARNPVPKVMGEGLVVAKPTLSLEFEP